MSDEQGILAAVLDAPDDDIPRLVYADWLDEQGKPERARFIRLQCQIARGDDSPDLLAAEAALLAEHHHAWVAELPRWPALSWTDGDEKEYGGGTTQFTRGFVSELTADNWQTLSRYGATAFAAAPVTRLRVKKLHGSSAQKFANWPLLSRVEELVLSSSAINDEQVFDIGRSTTLKHLRALDLSYNDLTEQGGVYLEFAEWLGGLRRLELGSNRFGPHTCRTLAALGETGKFANLQALRFSCSPMSDADVRPFFESSWLPPCLYLNFMGLTSLTAERIAHCSASRRLRDLILGWNYVSDEGAVDLSDSPHLDDLGILDLRSNEMTAQGHEILRRRFVSRPQHPFTLLLDDQGASDSTEATNDTPS